MAKCDICHYSGNISADGLYIEDTSNKGIFLRFIEPGIWNKNPKIVFTYLISFLVFLTIGFILTTYHGKIPNFLWEDTEELFVAAFGAFGLLVGAIISRFFFPKNMEKTTKEKSDEEEKNLNDRMERLMDDSHNPFGL